MVDVTVIIPTYTNTSGLLTLLKQLKEEEVAVVVVDNKPTNKKRQLVEKYRFTYLPQEKNIGFAAAVNRGAEKAKSKWLMIANDDIELIMKNSIDTLVKFAEARKLDAVSPVLKKPSSPRHSEPCLAGRQVVSESDSYEIENLGYRVLPVGRVELNFDSKRITQMDLDGLTAAFLLIKREVFEAVGGFDEAFFAYLEDVDLFLRLKKAGYTFGVTKDVEVIHNHLTTSSRMKGFKEKQDLINWMRIIGKNWSYFKSGSLINLLIERLRNLSGWIKAN
jgi:N-acetylglucosaminyl-diphospho-decaprenol L-rhamnosyltransferase